MGRSFLLGVGGGGGSTLQEKSVALNMSGGDQEITPDNGYDGFTKVTLLRPVTFVPENIKSGVSIGGITGNYVGSAIQNNLDGLVDNTITTFTMPQGKTKVRSYLFQNNTALTYADLQGATNIETYAFYGCTNAEIILPSTLTNIGAYAFYTAVKSSAPMELNCPNASCTIGGYAFYRAFIRKLSGRIYSIGEYAFSSAPITEVDITECTRIYNRAFGSYDDSGTNCHISKLNISINGSIGDYAFYLQYYLSNISITGNVTSIGTYAFRGIGTNRSNKPSNVLVLDFKNSSFTTVPQYAFSSIDYGELYLPSTVSSIGNYAISIGHSNIYFTSETPPTIQSSTFGSLSTTNLWVPYQKANAYRTKTNWTTAASSIKGYAAENTFQNGETLPTINYEGYGLTWYSDTAMTNQITTVSDATQKLYCAVGTTVLAYRITSVTAMDCNITFSDGTNTYALNDQVPAGVSLTVSTVSTDPNKPDVYMLDVNGTDYKPAASATITVDSDINVIALYYDGVNPPVNPVLNNNTWQQIVIGCQNGLAGSLWQTGDIKTDSNGINWMLVDLKENRFPRADGNGYTNAVFMMVPLMSSSTTWYTSSYSENYGQSALRSKMQSGGVYFNAIDATLAALADANKITLKANQANSSSTVDVTCSFFSPCYTEMGYTGTYNYATSAETVCNGVTMGSFQYFSDNTNSKRIKYYPGQSSGSSYWTRSRYSSYIAVTVYSSGSNHSNDVSNSYGACVCVAF